MHVTEHERLSTAEWYASLPTVYVSAGAFITDPDDRVLLVKPNYRPYWGFPGGIVEDGETPHDGCVREVQEETGLEMAFGRLLVLDWAPATGERPRSSVYFLFDGGRVADPAGIRLQEEELDDYAFVTVEEGMGMVAAEFAGRLPAAHHARRTGRTRYLPAPDPDGGQSVR